uniref:Uncharacterized protein AlNc14C54G4174 n=1 Tax=Albugo laibachii Nc14 TaxID=890382 RepID=F0WBY7_9STRA|nr:conserved hypothetical protein [Albugo laibachii Nc14]|eukprot:CCA18668.1 conserved hypothetical protein [Albugo laibachii Nc14]
MYLRAFLSSKSPMRAFRSGLASQFQTIPKLPKLNTQQPSHSTSFSSKRYLDRLFSSTQSNASGQNAGTSKSKSFFRSLWTAYEQALQQRPYLTKTLTATAIAATGDIVCQIALEKGLVDDLGALSEKQQLAMQGDGNKIMIDWKRLAIFSFLTGVVMTPILHQWYLFLARNFAGAGKQAIAKRLIMDQFLFAPSFLPVFFTMLLTLEGRFDKVSSKLHQEWWPTIKTNWIVWIPAQLINFGFVPGNLQVLFANVIGLFWNAYLSYVSHGSPHAEHEKQEIVKE